MPSTEANPIVLLSDVMYDVASILDGSVAATEPVGSGSTYIEEIVATHDSVTILLTNGDRFNLVGHYNGNAARV